MAKRVPTISIYRDRDGFWRWRMKSGNGEIIAQGESYTTASSARRGARAFVRNVMRFSGY